jgi:hypothetical protein
LRIDLHTHSNLSDGSLTPTELVRSAAEHGVGVLALTDHDTTAGLEEAQAEAARLGIRLLPGIELSVCEDDGRVQCHVLGYGIDPDAPALQECTAQLRSARIERFGTMIEQLKRAGIDLGCDFPASRMESAQGTIGRPHLAQRLVERGYCKTPQEAFDRYLGRGKTGFLPAPEFSAAAAITVVHRAGGVASLAHPLRSIGIDCPGGPAAFIGRFAKLGLDALEIQHPAQNKGQRKKLVKIAQQLELLHTGGSDFHGASRPDLKLGRGRGDIRVEPSAYHSLLGAIEQRRAGTCWDSTPASVSSSDRVGLAGGRR